MKELLMKSTASKNSRNFSDNSTHFGDLVPHTPYTLIYFNMDLEAGWQDKVDP